jgi:CRP/FNR family transcriptional regulator
MDMQRVAELLGEARFFAGIASQDIRELAEAARVAELERGAILFHEGEPALDFYYLASGEISLEIRSPEAGNRRITSIGAGEILGWASVLQLGRLTATARAIVPSVAVILPSRSLLALCEARPSFGIDFMRRVAHTLATRLDATRQHFLDISGKYLPPVEVESS